MQGGAEPGMKVRNPRKTLTGPQPSRPLICCSRDSNEEGRLWTLGQGKTLCLLAGITALQKVSCQGCSPETFWQGWQHVCLPVFFSFQNTKPPFHATSKSLQTCLSHAHARNPSRPAQAPLSLFYRIGSNREEISLYLSLKHSWTNNQHPLCSKIWYFKILGHPKKKKGVFVVYV